jgi:hypothetical protein
VSSLGGPFFQCEVCPLSFYCVMCVVCSMCCSYFAFGLLALTACMRTIKPVWKFPSVWRTYFNGQLLQFSW